MNDQECAAGHTKPGAEQATFIPVQLGMYCSGGSANRNLRRLTLAPAAPFLTMSGTIRGEDEAR